MDENVKEATSDVKGRAKHQLRLSAPILRAPISETM